MNTNLESPFFEFGKQIIGYLPNLMAGLILLLIGWLIGWIIKRITIQLLIVLRFERLLIRLQWRKALSKADIRYAVYNLIGNVVFFIVFLIFLNSALAAMNLKILSGLIQQGVLFIPKLIIAFLIFGIGWFIAARVSNSVNSALLKENLPHYSLISRLIKFITVFFFVSMALVEIEIAPQIVIIGFTTVMITLGIMLITITVFSTKTFLNDFLNKSDNK
jgi:hypothetical protein